MHYLGETLLSRREAGVKTGLYLQEAPTANRLNNYFRLFLSRMIGDWICGKRQEFAPAVAVAALAAVAL